MMHLHDGQCGLCAHFGEHHNADEQLIQLRTSHMASEELIDSCGHPRHAKLHLKVSPISGCDGFSPADASPERMN